MGWMDTIKRVAAGDYSQATSDEKNTAVRDVIGMASSAAAALTVQPFPLLDFALIAPVQIAMVQAIGKVHGFTLDQKSVVEILSTFGASIVAQGAIMSAAKFVPFLGWLITPTMAWALTYAIGEVSDYYFRNGRGVPKDELQSMFDRIYKRKRKEKQAEHKHNTTLKERLEQLKEARRDGLITEEEFEAKKAKILEDF